MKNIRCSDCRHYLGRAGWCPVARKLAGHTYRRTCAHWMSKRQSCAEIRAALADAGLSHYVIVLADLGGGQRALRLRHNVPESERFSIYRIAGLKVIANDPAIVGRATKGNRAHGGTPDESDPAIYESNAA